MASVNVSMRPASDDDRAFLFRLFASAREHEFAFLPLPPAAKETLMRQQFEAQTRDHAARYANADHVIVMQHETPIGRMLVHRGEEVIHLVDIALLPEHRCQGIGTQLVAELVAEGRAKNVAVRLTVFAASEAARLYQRLGFLYSAKDDAESVYRTMECSV